jgi:hypothetical protein
MKDMRMSAVDRTPPAARTAACLILLYHILLESITAAGVFTSASSEDLNCANAVEPTWSFI